MLTFLIRQRGGAYYATRVTDAVGRVTVTWTRATGEASHYTSHAAAMDVLEALEREGEMQLEVVVFDGDQHRMQGAAPDLLAACLFAEHVLSAIAAQSVPDALTQLRAAIAKADGAGQ